MFHVKIYSMTILSHFRGQKYFHILSECQTFPYDYNPMGTLHSIHTTENVKPETHKLNAHIHTSALATPDDVATALIYHVN